MYFVWFLLGFLTSGVEQNRDVLTEFQEVYMVLITSRLNLEEKDLAYRFGYSIQEVDSHHG